MTTKLSPADLAALKRAIAWARAVQRREPAIRMLPDPLPPEGSRQWVREAQQAAALAQSRALRLPPWRCPPCLSRDEASANECYGRGRAEVELRQRMKRAGVSLWDPAPLRALSEAERDGRNVVD